MNTAQTMFITLAPARLPELLRGVLAVDHPRPAKEMTLMSRVAYVPEYANGKVLRGERRYPISEAQPDNTATCCSVRMFGFAAEINALPFVTEVSFATGGVALRFAHGSGAVRAWLAFRGSAKSVLQQCLAVAMCTNGPIRLSPASDQDVALLEN